MNQTRIFNIVRIVIGIILLTSGIGKLLDASTALDFLGYLLATMNKNLPFAPQTFMTGLSILEIMLGTLFLIGKFLKPTVVISNILLGCFTGILVNVVGNNNTPVCGCSGALDFGMPLEMALLRNLVMIGLLVWMLNVVNTKTVSYS